MSFVYELKNRIILVFILQLVLFCVCYSYKETLFFLIANNLIFVNKNFYFLSTNLIELFNTYLSIVNFFILQFSIIYVYYSFFIFLIPGLYLKEILFFKNSLFGLIIIVKMALIVDFLLTMPLIFFIFSNFNKITKVNFFYFEIKLLDYFDLFKSIYYVTFFCLVTITIFMLIQNFFTITYLTKWKKIYYFCIFLLSNLLTFETITCFFVVLFLLLVFELLMFALLIKKNIKTRKKQDLNLRLLK